MDTTPQSATLPLPAGVSGFARPEYHRAVGIFARLFAGRTGNGAGLAVYRDGEPVLDIWAGAADEAGTPWTGDTGAMIYSASKGVSATVIHRLADRGLIDYSAPVAEYWPEFAAGGKGSITVRQLLSHRAGLSAIPARSAAEVLDHRLMEERLAAATPDQLLGKPIYHGLTIGWLMAGLARAITGKDMRELYRTEIADPLGVDGIHLGYPPAGSRTRGADLVGSVLPVMTSRLATPVAGFARALPGPTRAPMRMIYVPGLESIFAGDQPPILHRTQLPAGNGVCTARALAKMYGAYACYGLVDGKPYLSTETVRATAKIETFQLDRALVVPFWHLGFHTFPAPRALHGYGHLGAFGSGGWTDPGSGVSVGFVHNRMSAVWAPLDMTLLAMLVPSIVKSARTAAELPARTTAA
ncbi:serine hydrolase domain-containing protein [Nocardia sp. NPDC020380]|uniref:serine hydrolase domain-containing protein n=1 Tax=Nocardia sp. NPDC020380 TaxID=3364309 RepID=UPI003798ED33